MNRVAIFVDAGYLLARGAEALTGKAGTPRAAVTLDAPRAIRTLVDFAIAKTNCDEVLRVYWYDGAVLAPTADQVRLAHLDDVKLRLGSINSRGQQKGVDSLIIADMIELSRNQAATDMVLVGGDEDLRVGVQLAQNFGTRVHLLGVDIEGSTSQSPALSREVDTTTSWTVAELTFVLPRANIEQKERQSMSEAADQSLPALVGIFTATLTQADVDDIRTVWDASRTITQPYDGRLIARTAAQLKRALTTDERRDVRQILIGALEAAEWKPVERHDAV